LSPQMTKVNQAPKIAKVNKRDIDFPILLK